MKSKLYAFLHFILAWLARLVFCISCKTRKKEPPLSDGALLVCANHISVLDPVLICAVLKKHQPRIMAKKELFDVPFLGWLVGQLGAYPIDRKGANADVILKTIKMLEDGYCVGMFPQGTRRAGVEPETTPIKAGAGLIASKSKATVLPIHIKTKNYRIKAFRRVKLIIGDPIPYEEYTKGGELVGDSRAITQYIFDRICELGREESK
ncbi:MAG: 1-acyl-sn-glycerol-3-phosphate acyltransferase [Clostridia bacterium]|nr:1-acyl-sn-glycerol-3-phosphate acyltransferase [Clostridia bacterium]